VRTNFSCKRWRHTGPKGCSCLPKKKSRLLTAHDRPERDLFGNVTTVRPSPQINYQKAPVKCNKCGEQIYLAPIRPGQISFHIKEKNGKMRPHYCHKVTSPTSKPEDWQLEGWIKVNAEIIRESDIKGLQQIRLTSLDTPVPGILEMMYSSTTVPTGLAVILSIPDLPEVFYIDALTSSNERANEIHVFRELKP
jgi:hypothetical protein